MSELETRLSALAADAEFPPTPDLAAAVHARLAAAPTVAPAVAWRRRRRLIALALAAALLVPAAAVAAVPGARHAVLDWLGLRGVRVERVPVSPRPPSGTTAPPAGLGRPVTLAAARARLGFPIRVPRALGAPPRVYLGDSPPGGRVTLVYPARAPGRRVLITEFRGSQTQDYLLKALGPGTTIQRVRVAGAPGAWLAGRPHAFIYADARGVIRQESMRLAGSVLLWERDGVVLRLEGATSKASAVRVASSFR
jgi:hypothetical protein